MSGVRWYDQVLRAEKRYLAGTHRTVDPKATLEKAKSLMRPLGITRLANLTGLDCLGIPVFTAIRPNGRSLSTAQGKGLDDDAAAASALMESIETWHAEHLQLPRRRGPPRSLESQLELVDLEKLPRASHHRIDRSAPLDWVEGWDLMRARPVWVPVEAVTLDCVVPEDHEPVFDVSSNGLASGNHLLEAICHGLSEVIERDAEATWRGKRGQKRVKLETVEDPSCRAVIERAQAAGVMVAVWDIRSEVDVPAYGAAFMEDPREPAWRSLGMYQGFGCHLSPEVALLRALTEAAQTRLTYIAGSRDDFLPEDYARSTDAAVLERVWADLTQPAPGSVAWVDHRTAPRRSGPSFEADVETLLGRLRATGSKSAIAVDLSRPEHGVPVVKVLIPGRATAVEALG